MAAPYINTPGTERVDTTTLSAHHIDFSFAQPFASPSKSSADNLRNHMRGMRGAQQPMQTPRVRNALLDKRNPGGAKQQEFTPLLKSAHRNQILRKSALEDKENAGVPDTPAAFRSSYASQSGTLPVNSSILEPEHTDSFTHPNEEGTPVAPIASSSMLDSTPVPQLPRQGEGGVLDQGNVLTLRDQENKLDQFGKENFGLKLKIHYLEEALRKTGTQFQQATLKENVELKTEKMTLQQDLKKQHKRVQDAGRELDEYRLKYEEYQRWVKKRHANEQESEELERLQRLAEESQKVAEDREHELEEMRQRLESAEKTQEETDEVRKLKEEVHDLEMEVQDREGEVEEMRQQLAKAEMDQGDSDDMQKLKDEVQDLEMDVRERERQLDEKDEQLESLQDELQSMRSDQQQEELQQKIATLESEAQDRQRQLREKDEQLEAMRKKSPSPKRYNQQAEHLRQVRDLEAEVEDRDRQLDEKDEQVQSLQKQLATAKGEIQQAEHLQQDIDDLEAELNEKDEELDLKNAKIVELEQRIVHTNDRREQDDEGRVLQERLRITERALAEKDEEVKALQKDARKAENATTDREAKITALQKEIGDAEHDSADKDRELRVLQDRLRDVADKDGEIRALHERLQTARGSWDAEAQQTDGRLQEKDNLLREKEARLREKSRIIEERDDELADLQKRLRAAENSQEDVTRRQSQQLRQQSERVRELQEKFSTTASNAQAELAEKDKQVRDLEGKLRTEASNLQAKLNERDEAVRIKESELRSLREHSTNLQSREISDLQQKNADLKAEHAAAKESLEDEMLVLEVNLDEVQAQKEELATRVQALESEVRTAWRAKDHGTPARERSDLRLKLQSVEGEREELKATVLKLEASLDDVQARKTDLEGRVHSLESEVRKALDANIHGFPARERSDLRLKLRTVEGERNTLKTTIASLETQLHESALTGSAMKRQLEKLESELEADNKNNEHVLQTLATQRETELRAKVKALQQLLDNERTLDEKRFNTQLSATRKQHEKELKGLAKQIMFLHAKCTREETFRSDLVYTKRWFLMQVDMFQKCNAADLRVLEEMGITPDITVREKRPSLRTAALAVMACGRMKRMQVAWAGSKALHEGLMRKLEGMERRRGSQLVRQ